MKVRNLVFVLLIILTILGLIIPAISKVRSAANAMLCQSNMRQIVIACHNYHNDWSRFPNGTVSKADLPPQKRLSWLTHIFPNYMEGGSIFLQDRTKSWYDPANCPPRASVRVASDLSAIHEEQLRVQLIGDIRLFFCPINPARNDPSLPCPTHYIGIAGLGDDAAELSLKDRRCGVFGYDRRVTMQDIKDGISTTMALSEVLDGGPWTAGGQATVRGLAAVGRPYLGDGGQFTSPHRTAFFLGTRPDVNVAFADCSVRRLSATLSPQVFEALATIAGGEQIDELP